MKQLLIFPVLILVLLVSIPASSADFRKGWVAYNRGDYTTAMSEWKPLAEQGNADAQHSVGLLYGKGRGVPENNKTAAKWHRLAAEQGLAKAQDRMGSLYFIGSGVPTNNKIAMKWHALAAKQGNANGQYNFGYFYTIGAVVPRDFKTAANLWTLAAEQGHANAQVDLGGLYESGLGVPQDYVLAYMWNYITAIKGDTIGMGELNRIKKEMSSAQIAEGQRMARGWVAKHQN